MSKKKNQEVGYGRPPQEHQFKPGQSGNPKGRPPKKDRDALQIDYDETIADVLGSRADGVGTYEREMRGLLKRALRDKHVKSAIYLLREMRKYGVIQPQGRDKGQRRYELPARYPYSVGVALLKRHGPGPWPPAKVRPVIEGYLQDRDEMEKLFDDMMGFDLDV